MRHPDLRAPAALLPALLVAATALAQGSDFSFMPPGGKEILAGLVAEAEPTELAAIARRSASRQEWADWAASRKPELDEAALETFAGYAELNFPVAEDTLAALAETGDSALLPPDGKELAVAQCQFCHSLFTGYLMQDRDKTGWESTFKAPFHTEIPMTEVERATFVNYSVFNMPLAFQDVPPELRF